MLSAQEALAKLKAGNHRFVHNIADNDEINRDDGFKVIKKQEPIAIILGCSDARVPAELVFDRGLGQLFVIRVAGNVVAPSQIGSIEFAAEKFGVQLVVVLGHSYCGAVQATVDQLDQPAESRSPNLQAIVDRIRPAVEPLIASGDYPKKKSLFQAAVRANVATSVQQLRSGSEILSNLVAAGDLLIVGAEYSLETGVVEFFDE